MPSSITGDDLTNSLHPRLVATDREIAGFSLERAELSTGEAILKLENGMRLVGELRILTRSNYTKYLR